MIGATARRSHRLAALVLALAMLLLAACRGGDGQKATSKGAVPDIGSGRPLANGVRQFTDAELRNLLLPAGAVPVGLAPAGDYLIPNQLVATFFEDQEAALRSMAESGRVQGAAADYKLRSTPRATEQAVAISSSVSYYKTAAGAQAVITDPTMELVIHRFGLHTAEINVDKIAQESRAFRGFRDGDGPDLAAYLILFRRENVIGAVVVVVPAATDDGGKLALNLARRQAGDLTLPRRGAGAGGAAASPTPGSSTTVQRRRRDEA
jgi:hypothetical protein